MNFPTLKSIIVFTIVSVLIFATGAVFYIFSLFSAPEQKAETENFIISLKTSNTEIINTLHNKGYIKSRTAFNAVLTVKGWHFDIKPGGYLISKSMDAWKIAEILARHPKQKWVVIPEGLRKEETAEILAQKLNWEESQKENFLLNSREGYMFPDTYLLNLDYSGKQAADKLFNNFNEKLEELSQEFLKQNIRSDTAIKIASLIQREAANEDEMPVISGIIWNRLLKPMYLGIDATLQYALGTQENWWPIVQKKDYKIDSLYNTYIHKGHPPTPICSPGLAAIESVAFPEETDYFYYLHDENRQIHCAKTYNEHLENIKTYLLD